MFTRNLYYELKPFLPHGVRLAIRGFLARQKREKYKETWPIDEAASKAPAGWSGWPNGKKFAFVLTHDVEGLEGLAKCQRLMKLEMEMGFRSSFGLIPEGMYSDSSQLRADIAKNGFETMVHDLYHDGSLYASPKKFLEQAPLINKHLKAWNANGFRAGFMFHNLDWLHNLEVGHDSSTFDTDPFEPQPDGVRTIFPFWVQAPLPGDRLGQSPLFPHTSASTAHRSPSNDSRSGYIELPYTLPQDSTLFLLLRETTAEIWLRKLDWIAANGGMALVNVHPDYLCFEDEKPSPRTFPIKLYLDLLQHLQTRHAGEYWNALPREVAQHLRQSQGFPQRTTTTKPGALEAQHPIPAAKAKRHRIVMLVENNYPSDTRIKNEATLLNSAGYEVSVVCLKEPDEARCEMVNGVRVYRVPRIELFKKTIAENPGRLARLWLGLKTIIGYGVEYLYFTSACFGVCCYIFVRRGFDAIHAHNPPDTLFLAALPFKLLGKKFVFDHHDLCPELYRSRYGTSECLQTRILRIVEWCTLRLADMTIATNESYKQTHIERGNKVPDSIFVVRNGPNAQHLGPVAPSVRLRSMNKHILVYVGALNPQDGLDYLLRSMHHLRWDLKREDFHCVIMGSGDSLEDLRSLAKKLQLDSCVELTGFVSYEDLRANLAAADICVDPDPSSPLNDVSTWIKIMEYMAYAKPIVTFDLKETRFSAQDAAVYVKPNDEMAFAQAVVGLMDVSPEERQRIGRCGRKRVDDQLQWSVVGQNLLRAYEYLFRKPRTVGHAETKHAEV